MQLGGPYAFGPPPDRATAIGVLRAAVAAGVDHIDTAQYYGPGMVNGLIRDALSHPGGPIAGACERAGAFLRGWWGEPPSPPFAPEPLVDPDTV